MCKKLLFYFLFFTLNCTFSLSFAKISSPCDQQFSHNLLEKIDNTVPQIIEIEIKQNRKWQKNNYRMIKSISLNDFVVIPRKYKKNFNAKIHVKFKDGIECSFDARVRQHGKMRDHIEINRGNLFQSVDVYLKNGHINGIVNFILFRPVTRNNPEDEIFFTELLRMLDFLAPRTNFVKVKLNNLTTRMLFQEQAEKELLEYNFRREGPIFEGDERYFFLGQEKFSSSKSARRSFGDMSNRSQLARQTNSQWSAKSKQHQKIAYEALTQLNLFYLMTKNIYNNSNNSHIVHNINFDNNLLATNDPAQILKLNVYNAILFAANGYQGLRPGNRKFYWNSINNYFEPIYYNGTLAIDDAFSKPLNVELLSFPEKNSFLNGIKKAKERIARIKVENLFQKVKLKGSELSKNEVKKKLNQITTKLNNLENRIKKEEKKEVLQSKIDTINDITLKSYIDATLVIGSNLYLVLKDPNEKSFKACKNETLKCNKINLTEDEIIDLLRGRLTINENIYQFVGEYWGVENNFAFSSLQKAQLSKYNKIKFKNTNFYFDENITYKYDEVNSIFNIYQKYSGARAYFKGGNLNNILINFSGLQNTIDKPLNNYPFDQKGLTGCLSFIDLNFQNVSIKTSDSNCEDSVNLTNTAGYINKFESSNSAKDALDIDFSNIKIDKILVNNAKNDCVDLSYGKYEFDEINLSECGDKGVSVGEKSNALLNKATINDSDTGIATKDSSITKLNSAYFKNLKTCVSAYNKKQEFSGAMLEIKNMKCENYHKAQDVDKYSKIIIKNEL